MKIIGQKSPRKPQIANVVSPITIAVIGLGAMGQRNIAHLSSSPSYSIAGVYDVNEELAVSVADDLNVRMYKSIEELYVDDTQAVFVCTPHFLLAEYGMRVLESGKHLLIEKPMAMTVSDADAMVNLARDKELTLSVNYSRSHTDLVQ